MNRWAVLALLCGLAGCPEGGGDEEGNGGVEPFFVEEYESSYTEVRNCRPSGDHDLNNIRILADPVSLAPYQERMVPFPEGAVVLKEEYEFDDLACAGAIKQWTVMRKLATGSAPDLLDWEWQRVEPERRVMEEDPPRCDACHSGCGVPPDGHDGTCAMP